MIGPGLSILFGLGFALALEGVAYALFPAQMTKVARQLSEMGEDRLRTAGAAALALGAALIWLTRLLG